MVESKKILLAALIFSCGLLNAQPQTYLVRFIDKENNGYTLSNPSEFLSEHAIERRIKNKVVLDEKDLPVTQTYVDALITLGAEVLYPLKWFNGVVIRSDAAVKEDVKNQPFVLTLDSSVLRLATPSFGTQNLHRTTLLTNDYGASFTQTNMIGIPDMHQDDYKGRGVLIAVTDDGFLNADQVTGFSHLFSNSRIKGTWDLVDLDQDVYSDGGGHGTNVFSILAGYLPNELIGPATESDYLLFRTEDHTSESPIEELNWARAAEIADSAGADIVQVSLGYNTFDDPLLNYTHNDLNGQTSYISQSAFTAYSKGLIVVASAGNEGNNGWKKILCPADAEGVLAVGSVNFNTNRSSFSSIGNTADGRIKPDLMAMGAGTTYQETNGNVNAGNGTSFSSPLITGLVAGLMEAFPELTYKEIRQVLLYSCDRYRTPDHLYGYGIPYYSRASEYARLILNNSSRLIFPNPFASYIQLKIPKNELGMEMKWRLYTRDGILISDGAQVATEEIVVLSMNTELLRSGLYILQLTINNKLSTHKIIK